MKKENKKIEIIPTDKISVYEGSHNTDNVINLIVESIKKFGIQQPLILDKNNVIVAGNAIYKAALQCNIKELPCVILSDLTDDEIAQYRIADNKTSEFARWNEDKLKKELSYIAQPDDLQFCFDESITQLLQQNKVNIPKIEQGSKKQQNMENSFKEQLKKEEQSQIIDKYKYFSYVCSKCGKTVTIKA